MRCGKNYDQSGSRTQNFMAKTAEKATVPSWTAEAATPIPTVKSSTTPRMPSFAASATTATTSSRTTRARNAVDRAVSQKSFLAAPNHPTSVKTEAKHPENTNSIGAKSNGKWTNAT